MVKREAKPVAITFGAHSMQSGGHSLGVAVLASLADFCAAGDRVPGHLGPLDVRGRRHGFLRYSPRMLCAILSAMGAPFSLAAAKQSEYRGLDLEFFKTSPLAAFAKQVRKRSWINSWIFS